MDIRGRPCPYHTGKKERLPRSSREKLLQYVFRRNYNVGLQEMAFDQATGIEVTT